MNVLFICDGNVARSQEAELFFNAQTKGRHHATSAGTNPKIGKPIDPAVIEVMSEVGYDMAACYRKAVNEAVARQADVVVSFKPLNELPDLLRQLPTIRHWNIPDPKGQPLEFHRSVRNEIQTKVTELDAELDAS